MMHNKNIKPGKKIRTY